MSRPSAGLRRHTVRGAVVWAGAAVDDVTLEALSLAAAAKPALEHVARWVGAKGYVTLDELAAHCGVTTTAAHDLARWCGLAGRGRVRMLARATAAEHVEVALEALAQG